HAYRTLVPAEADGRLGRTDTVFCFDVEEILCNLVLEGVEGDDPYAPTACEHFNGSLQPFLDCVQLAVDRDTEGHKGAGRDANVEWSVDLEAETPLRVIELQRGEA